MTRPDWNDPEYRDIAKTMNLQIDSDKNYLDDDITHLIVWTLDIYPGTFVHEFGKTTKNFYSRSRVP